VGVRKACEIFSVSHAILYRKRRPKPLIVKLRKNHRALLPAEQNNVLSYLNSEAFVDQAPYQVYANLLDQGIHLCSVRTMCRILEKNSATRERRNQLSHPIYAKPELLAAAPNQVWSWDITMRQRKTERQRRVLSDLNSRVVNRYQCQTTRR